MPILSNIISRLREICGGENVLTEKEDLIPYGFDGTAALKAPAECVVFPNDADQLVQVVRLADAQGIPVVTRGSGTGLSGGSVPCPGGIVLCTVKLDRILEVDPANLTILVEPGVTTEAIAGAAEEAGLFYPPDPGSMKISTIGGNVAENSGGLRGLKYGVTRNYVMGMEVVLADGEVVWLGNKCVKDVAGYALKDLFIGSEGTLGLFTKLLLRLIPKPSAKQTMLAAFDAMEQAAEAVSAIIAAKIIPCTLEFLDRTTLQCVEEFAHIGLPTDCEALILMETDGHPAVVAEEAEKMSTICREHACREIHVAGDAAEAARLASARRTAFSALARVAPTTILEDVTVPRSVLAQMVRCVASVAEKYHLKIGTFGHMGDGNLHPTFLTNERNTEEMHRVEEAFDEIFARAIALGGTITGEHGVGLAKKRILPRFTGDIQLELLRRVKRSLDPKGILNPGKIFTCPLTDEMGRSEG